MLEQWHRDFYVNGRYLHSRMPILCSKFFKNPPALDANEPSKIADTIKKMNLNYVVLTTVNRDDLANQGAPHISRCIKEIQRRSPRLLIEILMPDFRGDKELLQKIIDASPTDGLWDDKRTDEDQLGASYSQLEEAMEYGTGDGVKVLEKFSKMNQHKIQPIPTFKL